MANSRVLLIAFAVVAGVIALYFAGEALFNAGETVPGSGEGDPITTVTTAP
jgi:hypothetical protein